MKCTLALVVLLAVSPSVALGQDPAKSPKRQLVPARRVDHQAWEYHVIQLGLPTNPQSVMDQLNPLGTAGWELVSVIPHPDGQVTAILKRRK